MGRAGAVNLKPEVEPRCVIRGFIPNSEVGFTEGNKENEGRTLSDRRSAVKKFSCTLVVPRRLQWNGLVPPPSNPHPGGMEEISRGLSVSDTPGEHEQTGPHPGGVPEPPGRPFSGTPAGVRHPWDG